MKLAILGLFLSTMTSAYSATTYICHTGQNTFNENGFSQGTLLKVKAAKVPADGKLHEFKADKIYKGYVYLSINEYASSGNVVARALYVPEEKRIEDYKNLEYSFENLSKFFEFENIEATNIIGSNDLRSSFSSPYTVPAERSKSGQSFIVKKSVYLNCFVKSPKGDGIEFD